MKHMVLANSPLSSVLMSFMLIGTLTACPSGGNGGDDDGGVEDDLTPPAAPSAIEAVQLDRITSDITWVAPADDDGSTVSSYELRFARDPMEPGVAFEEWGTVIATETPSVPGEIDGAYHYDLPGFGFYIGLVAYDAAGNRSEPVEAGPFFQQVDISQPRLPTLPDDDNNGLGYQIEAGDFNADQYQDLAIAAPFKRVDALGGAGAVYVYFGSPTGISDTPDLEIVGSAELAQFGNSLAVLDWDGDEVSDLAIGSPYTSQVYIFNGQSLIAGTPLSDIDADTLISADANSAWFAGSFLGWTMVAGRFDNDQRDDLAISAVAADAGVGAIAIIYGGTSAGGDIALSEVDSGLMDGAVASVVFAPGEAQGAYTLFGSAMQNLGRNGPGTPEQLGVAFFQGADSFIIRGRPQRPADPGVHVQDFDPAMDLRATVDPLDAETFFGYSQGAVMDINGDGVRELAIGSYRDGADAGTVTLIDGASVGEQSLADVTISTISGLEGQLFGSAIVGSVHTIGPPDFDHDGNADLVIAGNTDGDNGPGVGLYVWYNDGYHDFTQNLTTELADAVFAGPTPEFVGTPPTNGGTPITARSVGDIDADGFFDIVWADWEGNERDGSFVVVR